MPTLWAELCHRVRDSDNGNALGYGLCLDSLHPTQARFNAVNWLDGVVMMKSNKSSGTG